MVNVSVIVWPDAPPTVTTSDAPSMDALNVLPPVALGDMLKTTNIVWPPVIAFNDRPEKLYLPFTAAVVLTARTSYDVVSFSDVPASGSVLLYNLTSTMSAFVAEPFRVIIISEMFICSPRAEKLKDIIVTLVDPIWVVVPTRFVPVIERLPNTLTVGLLDIIVNVPAPVNPLTVMLKNFAPPVEDADQFSTNIVAELLIESGVSPGPGSRHITDLTLLSTERFHWEVVVGQTISPAAGFG